MGEPGKTPQVRRVFVTLERWSGSAGEAYRSCPSFPSSTATLDGHPMRVVSTGGEWSDNFGCTLPTFAIDVAELGGSFALPETTFTIADANDTFLMRTSNVFTPPRIAWQSPSDGALHPGSRATLAITPAPLALLLDDVSFLPDGGGAPQRIDTLALDLTAEGLSFDASNLTPGKGTLSISSGGRPLFGAAVHACVGVPACHVERAACIDADCMEISAISQSLDERVHLPIQIDAE